MAHIPTGLPRPTRRYGLDEMGAPMKVQQKRMRHAPIQTTMNVYGRAMTETKRQANSQVVERVFGPNSQHSPEKRVLRLSNKWQLFLMGDNGDFPEVANFCKLLIGLVAGAGFEPATFGL